MGCMMKYEGGPQDGQRTDTDATPGELLTRLQIAYLFTLGRLDERVKEATADKLYWRLAHIAAGLWAGYVIWGS